MRVILFANTDWYLYNFRRSLVVALCNEGYDPLLISPSGPYGPRLRKQGFRWLALPMDRSSLNPLREMYLLWSLWRLFRRERPALVHAFTIKCVVYGSIAARLAGVPVRINAVAGMGYVFTSRDLKARLLRPLVRVLLRLALGGRGAMLILQNPDDVLLFKAAGLIDTDKIRLIAGSGVDCSTFKPRSGGRRPGALRVLLAARMLWDKGIAEYVEAARRLRGEGRAIQCFLAGSPDPGNPAAVPEATIRGWADTGVVKWLGHVDDMPALLSDIDIAVLPSYREGLPKGLVESAACGLPLIATDVPGCREVIADGIDGLLVPVRDSVALAHAIARLHDAPELAAELGRAARQKALDMFDERIVIAKTIAVYEELQH